MSARIENNNTPQVLSAIKKALEKSLEESGLLVETAAKRLCPVVTGRLKNSITHQKSGKFSEEIGTNVDYARIVELKPSNREGHPFLRPSIQNSQDKIADIFKRNLT